MQKRVAETRNPSTSVEPAGWTQAAQFGVGTTKWIIIKIQKNLYAQWQNRETPSVARCPPTLTDHHESYPNIFIWFSTIIRRVWWRCKVSVYMCAQVCAKTTWNNLIRTKKLRTYMEIYSTLYAAHGGVLAEFYACTQDITFWFVVMRSSLLLPCVLRVSLAVFGILIHSQLTVLCDIQPFRLTFRDYIYSPRFVSVPGRH